MARTVKDPIPVGPFLEWCRSREAQIRRELDRCPAIQARVGEAGPTSWAPRARLVMELGWPIETGQRRLWRWEFENQGETVARATIEDALEHAGAAFSEVYPDLPTVELRACRLGMARRMTDSQVVAAHTVYIRNRMTTVTLGELLWERFGYASAAACAKALEVAFKGLGLPIRQCCGLTRAGARCSRAPLPHSDFCPEHGDAEERPSQRGGRVSGITQTASTWVPSPALVERARALHIDMGASMNEVGRRLLPETPLRSAQYLSKKFAVIADAQGWYRPLHAGRKPLAAVDERAAAGCSI